MKVALAVLLGLLAGGCVTPPSEPQPAAGSIAENATKTPTQVVCKREKPTGSNRPVKVCRKVPTELEREQARRDVRVLQRQTGS